MSIAPEIGFHQLGGSAATSKSLRKEDAHGRPVVSGSSSATSHADHYLAACEHGLSMSRSLSACKASMEICMPCYGVPLEGRIIYWKFHAWQCKVDKMLSELGIATGKATGIMRYCKVSWYA